MCVQMDNHSKIAFFFWKSLLKDPGPIQLGKWTELVLVISSTVFQRLLPWEYRDQNPTSQLSPLKRNKISEMPIRCYYSIVIVAFSNDTYGWPRKYLFKGNLFNIW